MLLTKECQMMTVKDVKEYLGIGNNAAYALFHREDFPSLIIGRILLVRRESFLNWIAYMESRKESVV